MKKQSSSEKPPSSNRSHNHQSRHRHSSSVSANTSSSQDDPTPRPTSRSDHLASSPSLIDHPSDPKHPTRSRPSKSTDHGHHHKHRPHNGGSAELDSRHPHKINPQPSTNTLLTSLPLPSRSSHQRSNPPSSQNMTPEASQYQNYSQKQQLSSRPISSSHYAYPPSNQQHPHHQNLYPQNYYQPIPPGPPPLYPYAPQSMVSSYYPQSQPSIYQPQSHANPSSSYDPVFLYPQSSIFASYLQLVPPIPAAPPQSHSSGPSHYRQLKHHNSTSNRKINHSSSSSSSKYGALENQSPGILPYYHPLPPPLNSSQIDPYQYMPFPPSFLSIPRGPPKKPKKSGFALWVGNLPPRTTLLELCALFGTNEIQSIFLIQRTLCAFVNYVSEQALHQGKLAFETRGRVLRGNHLVVKIKTSSSDLEDDENDDFFANQIDHNHPDLKKAAAAAIASPSSSMSSSSTSLSSPASALSTSSSSSALSAQNTQESEHSLGTSGSLSKERYFICKSLTVEDLQASAVYGLWATQTHNQSLFNEAFKNCDNVYLIFSANRGGEYFGYARMASEIPKTADKDLLPLKDWNWASQDGRQGLSAGLGGSSSLVEQMAALNLPSYYASPNIPRVYPTAANPSIPIPAGRIVDDSSRGTLFWEVLETEDRVEDGQQDVKLSSVGYEPLPSSVSQKEDKRSSKSRQSSSSSRRPGSSSPPGSSRSSSSSSGSTATVTENPQPSATEKKKRKKKARDNDESLADIAESASVPEPDSSSSNNWTVPFRIEWQSPPGKTVPFYMVRHLHNPYNRNQPVKIARDGTEIEPSVGQQILAMFHDN